MDYKPTPSYMKFTISEHSVSIENPKIMIDNEDDMINNDFDMNDMKKKDKERFRYERYEKRRKRHLLF